MTESSLGHLGRAGKGIEAWGHLIRAVSSLLSNPPFAEATETHMVEGEKQIWTIVFCPLYW